MMTNCARAFRLGLLLAAAHLSLVPATALADSEDAKLTASDGAIDDRFGYSVSVFADVVVVGAIYAGDSGSHSGSAYRFRYDGSNWVEEAKLTSSDAAADDLLCYSVSVSGAVTLVGAYPEASTGSAYVFGAPEPPISLPGPGLIIAPWLLLAALVHGSLV